MPGKAVNPMKNIVGTLFDYLVEHPRLVRMLLWEQAEGFQTYKQIFSQFETDETEPLLRIFEKAQKAGLLHSDFSPLIQITMALQVCLSYFSWLPM
jgi:hypothetical protein